MPAWLTDLVTFDVLRTVAIIGFLIWGIVKVWKPLRALVRFFDALIGSDERDHEGRKIRPGILDRMAALETKQDDQGALLEEVHHEVAPNTGGSIKDAVARVELTLAEHIKVADRDQARLDDVAEQVDKLEQRLED